MVPEWLWETAGYKATPKSLPAVQVFRGAHSTVMIARETWGEGRRPALVDGA
jgi:hypothetical protein